MPTALSPARSKRKPVSIPELFDFTDPTFANLTAADAVAAAVATSGATSGQPKSHRSRTARKAPRFPQWFPKPKSQRIAEYLAHSRVVDVLVGLPDDMSRHPYSCFKPEKVEAFFRRFTISLPSTAI